MPTPGVNGPWRIALIERGDDPKLIVATITLAEDVTPVQLAQGHFYNWHRVLDFVTARVGEPVELTPISNPAAWSIRPRRKPPAD
jgi:hypothetical protein